jgi:hypothetical protein
MRIARGLPRTCCVYPQEPSDVTSSHIVQPPKIKIIFKRNQDMSSWKAMTKTRFWGESEIDMYSEITSTVQCAIFYCTYCIRQCSWCCDVVFEKHVTWTGGAVGRVGSKGWAVDHQTGTSVDGHSHHDHQKGDFLVSKREQSTNRGVNNGGSKGKDWITGQYLWNVVHIWTLHMYACI